MAGIQLYQPNGAGTLNAEGAQHPSPVSIENNLVCQLSLVGASTRTYRWSLSKPAESASTLSSLSSAGPSFVPDVDGGAYSITLTDINENVYVLDIVAATVSNPGNGGGTTVQVTLNSYADVRAATFGASAPPASFTVKGREDAADGGEGHFIYVPDSALSDNDGTVLEDGDGNVYHRVYSGPIDSRWFGARGDLATSRTDAKIVASSTTLTTNASAFTADDVGKLIQIAVPAPGTQGAGTLAFTASSNAVVGTGTSFTTDFYIGMTFMVDRADGSQAVQLFEVKSVTDDTHLTLTDASLPFHNLTSRNWWTTATWTTTIAGYNSATSITLDEASAITQNIGTTLCTRICYGPDQSDAIEAAVAALEAGQKLEIPAGHYLLSRALEIGETGGGKPITVSGAGEIENVSMSLCGGTDNIVVGAALGTVLHFTSTTGIEPVGRCNVENLVIVGPGHNELLCGGYAPREDGNAEGVNGANLFFANWRAGLDLEFTLGNVFSQIKAVGCIDGIRLGRGIDGVDTVVCNSVTIYGIDVQLCGAGVALQQCKGINIYGGLNQANQISWRIAPYDPPSGAGIGGIEGVKVHGVYQELNQHTMYFHPQNGICRQIEFDKCFFGDVSHTIQFGRAGDYAIMGEFHFKECVLAAQKWSFPSDVLVADVEFDNCTHPSSATDLFTFGNPAQVTGLRVKGAYGDRSGQIADNGITTVSGGTTYTPNWSIQGGGMHRLNVTGNCTIAAPTRMPAGAYIDFAITRTNHTVTWAAAYKHTPTMIDDSITCLRWWTPNGTDFYLS